MANKMLIDATHPEETRVVVLRGNRVEEFDFESANRKQLRGNIYLAKVTRVEPSLQAAFVDYGGNRHGFLAFSEIHPDYYQIPVADRQALIDEEERAQRRTPRVDRALAPRRRGRDPPIAARARQDDDTLRSELAPRPGGDAGRSAGQTVGPDRQPDGSGSDQAHDVAEAGRRAAADLAPPVSTESAPDITEPEQDEPAETEMTSGDRPAADSDESETTEVAHTAPETTTRATARKPAPKATTATMAAKTAATTKPRSSNRSAAPTRWKKCPTARRATAASTRSRR